LTFIDVNITILINSWYNSFKGGCLMDLILTAHKMRIYPNDEQIQINE